MLEEKMNKSDFKKFGEVTFIGRGAILDPEVGVIHLYRWVDGKQIFEDPLPYPVNDEEIEDTVKKISDFGV